MINQRTNKMTEQQSKTFENVYTKLSKDEMDAVRAFGQEVFNVSWLLSASSLSSL